MSKERDRYFIISRHASSANVLDCQMKNLAEAIEDFAKERNISLEGARIIYSYKDNSFIQDCGECLGKNMGIRQEDFGEFPWELAKRFFEDGPEVTIMITSSGGMTDVISNNLTPDNRELTKAFMNSFWSDEQETCARPIIVNLAKQICEKIW